MTKNMVFSDVESQRRVRPVGNDVAPGTPLISGGLPAVTITGSGDYDGNAVTMTANGVTTVLAGGNGGVGLAGDEATVSFTGSYAFPVAGASAATEPGTPVYLAADGTLTLTATDNDAFGVVEFFRGETSATDTVVTIGA